MHIKTIAEFAETTAIIGELRKIGVHYAQGYGVSQPLPLMALKTHANTHTPPLHSA